MNDGPGRRFHKAAADPIDANARTPQRSGPARTSNAGARSGTHGRYGIAQSHISAKGPSAADTGDDSPSLESRIVMASATTAVAPAATSNRQSGASSATRTGPSAVQSTMWMEAGSSQIATATPDHTQRRGRRRATIGSWIFRGVWSGGQPAKAPRASA